MAEPTRWKKFWESYWPRIIATFLVIGVLLFPRRCEVWALLSTGPLNELGDFLAGVFTPAALGWLVYGYFLQKTELGLQRQELQETRETLGQQVEVLREQAAVERQQARPSLFLRQGQILRQEGNINKRRLSFKNLGAPALNLEVTCWKKDGGPPEEETTFPYPEVVGHDEERQFHIFDGPASSTDSYAYFIKACFISERYERLYQRWEITFTHGTDLAKSQEITTGPEPLIEDSSAR